MDVTESPAPYVNARYRLLDDLHIQDYTDADAHRTEQAPDRNSALIITGWAYAPDPQYPLDYAWRKGA